MRLSRADFASIKAKTAQKRAKRAQKMEDNASLASVLAQTDAGRALAEAVGVPMPPKTTGKAPRSPANAPKARKPKSSRKRLVAKLDAIFSMFIRLRGKKRTGGVCELCAKRPIEVCFHWVSRGDYATRWDADNAVASCRGDNYEETFRKQKYRDMHISRVGIEERERIESKARTLTHFTDEELRAMLDDLTNRTRLL